MSTEIKREDFGEAPSGYLTLITFRDNVGETFVERYQLRYGVRTVGDWSKHKDAKDAAEAIAKSE